MAYVWDIRQFKPSEKQAKHQQALDRRKRYMKTYNHNYYMRVTKIKRKGGE